MNKESPNADAPVPLEGTEQSAHQAGAPQKQQPEETSMLDTAGSIIDGVADVVDVVGTALDIFG